MVLIFTIYPLIPYVPMSMDINNWWKSASKKVSATTLYINCYGFHSYHSIVYRRAAVTRLQHVINIRQPFLDVICTIMREYKILKPSSFIKIYSFQNLVSCSLVSMTLSVWKLLLFNSVFRIYLLLTTSLHIIYIYI